MRVSRSDGRAFQAEVKLQQQDRAVPRLSDIITEKRFGYKDYMHWIYDDDDTDTRGKICYACQNVPQIYKTKKPNRSTVFRAKHSTRNLPRT
jgi:hypothetical protein